MTQEDLASMISEQGYPIGNAQISKCEKGSRKPSPEFIYWASICLELTTDQRDALMDSHFADVFLDFFNGYNGAIKDQMDR